MSERECCGRCKFFTRTWSTNKRGGKCFPGDCRRYPPAVLQNKVKTHFVSWFPFVQPWWVCGEFQPKEEVGAGSE